jgi:hypothetical protein
MRPQGRGAPGLPRCRKLARLWFVSAGPVFGQSAHAAGRPAGRPAGTLASARRFRRLGGPRPAVAPPLVTECLRAALLQVKVNTDESPDVATHYNIRSIPTVMVRAGA